MQVDRQNKKINRKAALAVSLAAMAGLNQFAKANSATWDTATADSFWNAPNWDSNGAAYTLQPGDSLFFDGAPAVTLLNNNFTAGTTFSGLTFDAGASGFTLTGNQITLGGNITDSSANAQIISMPLLLNANRNINVAAGSLTISGAITDGGGNFGLSAINTGIAAPLILSGANTYTGATTIGDSGTVLLDFTQATAPANNIISGSSTLSFSGAGGTLTVNGNTAGATNLQSFAATTIADNTAAGIGAIGSSGTVGLGLGTFTRGNFATANFLLPAQGSISTSNTLATPNGILGGWATTSNGYATVSGNQIVAYSAYTSLAAGPIPDGAGATNVQLTASGVAYTTAASPNINTLSYNPGSAGNATVTVSGQMRFGAQGGIYNPTGSGSFTVSGGSLTAGGNTAGTPGQLYLIDNGTTGTVFMTVGSSIADNGVGGTLTLIKSGTAAINLSTANTYTGGTIIDEGRFQTNNTAGFSTGPVTVQTGGEAWYNTGANSSNAFNLNGIGVSEGGIFRGAIRLNTGSTLNGTITFQSDSRIFLRSLTGTGTLNGLLTGPGGIEFGCPNDNNSGTVVLNGTAGANNWSGNLTITAGTLKIGKGEEIPNGAGFGNVLFNTIGQAATLDLNGNTETINGLSHATGTNGVTITNSAVTTGTLIVGDNNQTSTFNGNFQNGAGTLALGKVGTGILTLTGSNNYTGATAVQNGTLVFGAGSALPNNANFILGGATTAGVIDLGGNNVTLASLSSTGTGGNANILSNSNSNSVTVTYSGGSSSFGGSIRDNLGSGAQVTSLTINSGSLALNGANTYTGNTTVNTGTLVINGSTLASGNVNLTSSNAALAGTGSAGNASFSNGAHLRLGPSGADRSIGSLTLASAVFDGADLRYDLTTPAGSDDLLSLTGTATFTNNTSTISFATIPGAGTYTLISAGSALNLSTMPVTNLPSGSRSTLTLNNTVDPKKLLLIVGSSPLSLTWRGTANTSWDVATTVNWTDNGTTTDQKFFNLDSVTFNDNASTFTVQLDSQVSPGNVTVNNTAHDYTIQGGGGITGLTGLTKSGGAKLILNINDNYTGPTAVQGGTLVLANGSALPNNATLTIGSGVTSGAVDLDGNSITVAGLSTSGTGAANLITNSSSGSNVTINYNGVADTFNGSINDGAGTVALNVSNGALTLPANSTYTGGTNINGNASVQIGAGTTTGNLGNGTVQLDGTLSVNRSDTVTFASPINGGGSLLQIGTGTIILTANNSYGSTTINSGVLQVGAGTTTGSLGNNNVINNANLIINRSDAISINNTISGTSATALISNIGSGTITIGGNNSNYLGNFNITNGMVLPSSINAFGAIPGGSVSISGTGAIDIANVAAANFGVKGFFISGAGPDGNGVIINSSTTAYTNAFEKVVLTGNATIGGVGRYDIRNGGGTLDLAGHTLTKTGVSNVDVVAGIITSGTIEINQGNFGIQTTTTAQGTGLIEVNSSPNVGDPATILSFWQNPLPNITMPIRINGDNVQIGNNASGAASTAFVSSPLTLNGNLTVTSILSAPSPFTFAGPIGEINGPHGITKTGSTLFTMSGNNTYSGTTQVSGGTLMLSTAGNNNIPNSANVIVDNGSNMDVTTVTGGYIVASGQTVNNNGNFYGNATAPAGSTIKGTGTFNNAVSANTGGTISPGTGLASGSLNVSTVALSSAHLNFNLDGNGASELVVNSADGLSVAGISSITLSNLGGLNTGTYTILDYNISANSPLADLSNFSLATTSLSGFSFALVNNPGNTSIDLAVTPGAASVNAEWNVPNDGSWSVGGNWTGGTAPHSAGDTAGFGPTINGPHTVTLDVPETVGTVNFNSTGTYTIAGTNALTLDTTSGSAAINVIAGSHTISAPVIMNKSTGIDVATGSTLSISGNLTGGNAIALTKTSAGTLALKNLSTGSLNVNAGKVQISQKGSNTAQGGTNVIVQSLSIASTAQLDMTNNSMVIDYTGSVGTLVNDTRLKLQANLLTTSLRDLHHTLGYGDNALLNKSSFNGTSVDSTSILVKYTYPGDTNLDGKVDVTDLGALSSHWQQSGVWTGGDFNYDGTVNVTDLGVLASNWQQGVTSPLLGANSFQQALEAVGLGNVQVPEPTMLGLLGMATMGLMSRKRRK